MKKYIFTALLAAILSLSFPLHAGRTILVDGEQTQGTLHQFWQVSNFAKGSIRTFATEDDVDLLRSKAPFAKQVVVDYTLGGRFPDSEEYYFGQDADGELITDFTGLIRRLRTAINAGFTPWVGLENVPPLMSDPVNWSVYGNSEPAKDNELFHRYVRLAMEAFIEAFGREEVARWKFIIATEPDLNPAHWTGTREEFFDLLDHTLEAVLEVLPEADISPGNILNPTWYRKPQKTVDEGGVSLERSRDHWGLDIIDHMATGSINTGDAPGNKMDFFSFSWYGRIGASPDTLESSVRKIRDRLARYPQYRDLPIDVREFGILVDENRHRLYAGDASEWGASFYAAIARRVYDLNIRHVFEWDSATQGVLHPRGRVISMLDRMAGGESLEVEVLGADSEAECNAIASSKDGSLYILIYNHHDQRHTEAIETVHLEISNPLFADATNYELSEWTIDRDHVSWIYAFLDDAKKEGVTPPPSAGQYEGSPYRLLGDRGVELFTAQIDKYRALSEIPRTRFDESCPTESGRIHLDLEMPGHSVRLLKFSPTLNPDEKTDPCSQ